MRLPLVCADEGQRRTIRRDRERAEIAHADDGRCDDVELLLDVRGWWSSQPDGDSNCCPRRQCHGGQHHPCVARRPGAEPGEGPSRRRQFPLRILDVQPYIGKVTDAGADVLAQAAPKQTSKGGGSPRREPLPLRLALEHLGEDLANRAAGKHRLAGQHLEEDASEGPHVGAAVGHGASHPFR